MKKSKLFIILFFIMTASIFTGCSKPLPVSCEQTKQNIAKYEKQIKTILQPLGGNMRRGESSLGEGRGYQKLIYEITKETGFIIMISSSVYEDATITLYHMIDNEPDETYQTQLLEYVPQFIELTDYLTCQSFTEKQLREFLKAPEEKYPIERFRNREDGQYIAKAKGYQWEIYMLFHIVSESFYTLAVNKDVEESKYEETLSFCGPTKASMG